MELENEKLEGINNNRNITMRFKIGQKIKLRP